MKRLTAEERDWLFKEHRREIAGRDLEPLPADPEGRKRVVIRQLLSTEAGQKLIADSTQERK
jgi:hypothetical protein